MKVTSLKDQSESIQDDQLKDIADISLKQEKNEITSFGNHLEKQANPSNDVKSVSNNNNSNTNAKPEDDKQMTITRLLPNDDKQNTIPRLPPNDDKTRNSQEVKMFENKLPSSQAHDIVSLAGSDTHQILKKDIMAESGANNNNNGKINETKEAASLNNEKKVIVDIEENSPEMTSNKKKPQKNTKEEVKENPVSEKHRRIISWIVAVLVILITLSIAIYCTVTYAKRKHLPTEYDNVIENWKNAPIITIRPSNVGCAEYLTEYEFPGTIDGCDCRASLSVIFGNKIYPSSCSDEQKQNGCSGVNSTPTVTFTSWMINSQIFRLCVDRLQGFSYTDSDCKQTGFRICGVGSAAGASKTNMFCLPTTSSCPINGISYGVTAPDSTFASVFNTGVGNIYVSRQQVNSQPLAFTRISTGSGECKYFKEYHFFDSFVTPYQLLRNKDKTCEFADTDFRFNNLFSLTETNLFTANSYSSIISALPAYPLAQNQNYFLTTRNYIPWQQEGDCRYTHMQRFVDLDSSIRMINYLWVGAVVVSWLVFIAFGIVVNVLRLKYDYYLTKWQVLMVWLLIILLLGLIVAGFVFSLFLNMHITSMKDAKCSDLSTNSMLTGYRDDFFMTYFIAWIILLAAIILLVLICLIFIKIIFFRPKERVDQDEEKDHLGDDDLLLGENDNNNEKDRGNNLNGRKKNSIGNDGSNGNGGYSNTFNIDGNNIINDSTKGVTYNNPSSAQNTPRKNNKKNNNDDDEFNNENNNNNNNKNRNNAPQGQGNNKYRSSKTYNSSYKLKDGENTSAPKLKNITLSNKTRNYEMEVVTEAGNPTQATRSRKSIDAARDKFLLNRYGGGTRNGEDNSEANKVSSLVQMEEMEDLEDHNDWEFEIDGYVKQHREARAAASNRIGGGYDIAKNKEKYLAYKFQHRNRRSQLNSNNEPDIFGYTENNNNNTTTNLALHDPSATESADKTEQQEGVIQDDSTQKKSNQDNAENSNQNQLIGSDAGEVGGGVDTNNNNATPNPNQELQ